MKKSKVIVPAMALLLFSTAASVTSTVAWFTSTRTFTSQAGKFAVTAMGNLACTVTQGIGTDVNENNRDVDVELGAVLGDASYDLGSSHLFTDINASATNFEDLGPWAVSATDTSADWKYGVIGTVKNASNEDVDKIYYYGATWSYTFSYTYGAEATDMNLYFDIANSSAEYYKNDGTAHGNEAQDTCKGFRLAFQAFTKADDSTALTKAAKSFVWAPFRATTDQHQEGEPASNVNSVRYVKQTVSQESTTYSVVNYNAEGNAKLLGTDSNSAGALGLGAEGDRKADTLANCLGVFKQTDADATNTVQIKIQMTAWYEGTDPLITNRPAENEDPGTLFQQVSSSLVFAARQAPAA